jgi:hypothetical protein
VIWVLVGVWLGLGSLFNPIYEQYSTCYASVTDHTFCTDAFERQLAVARQIRWFIAALWAFVPVVIAWLMAYVVIGVVRWIRRGFQT